MRTPTARISRTLGLAVLLCAALAGPAQADVSQVTVDPSTPSTAAGARTTYVIGFRTSVTGGLSGSQKITITFPAGTDLSTVVSSQVFDTSVDPSTQIGACSQSGTVATCGLFSNKSIGAGDAVRVVVNGVTNPGTAGSRTLTVATTTDPMAVTSPSYTITRALALTGLTVDPSSPTNAAGGRTSYVIAFKTSATGGLSGAANSKITVSFPAGTDLSTVVSSQLFDTTAAPGTQIGACSQVGTVATCGPFSNDAIPSGDTLKLVINGVTNPAAGSKTLTVSTTSDPSAVTSPAYTINNASPLTGLTVDPSSPTNAAGGRTSYAIAFKTSATGGLSGAANSKITVSFPAGTDLSTVVSSQLFDTTAAPGTQIGACSQVGTVATCGPFSNDAIPSGDSLRLVINGVTNPAAGSKTLTVSTTSDPSTVTSPAYTINNASPLTGLTVDPSSPTNAAGGRTTYAIAFKTSATGGLSGAANSKITVTFPAGTDLSTVVSSQLFDTTAAPGTQIGACSQVGTVATCGPFSNDAIPSGDSLKLVINGVTNPSAGSKTLTVSTTSDTPTVTSPQYSIVAAHQISQPVVTPSGSTYTVTFTTSSTGGMSGAAHSQMSLALPSGTSLASFTGGQVFDSTVGPNAQVGGCSAVGTVVTCGLFSGSTTAAGHAMRLVLNGIGNPPQGSYTLTGSTTSDPAGVTSGAYAIGPAPPAPPPPPPPPAQAAASSQSPGPAPPTATSAPPSVSGANGVALSAVVNPNGLPTTVRFEYGLDPSVSGAPLVFDARTPDQALPADSADHTVTADVSGLLANAAYHVRVVATNSAGTVTGADQTFTTKADPPPPPPVLGTNVNVSVVSGLVFVKLPGAAGRQLKGTGFIPLTEARQLPVGTQVDARRGTLRLVSATTTVTKTQAGTFSAALFQIEQSRAKSQKGLTDLRLLDGSRSVCKATPRAKRPPKSKVLQLLKADVHGKFRSSGRYAAATVRGTAWDMSDRCDGTLTVVRRGTVVVTDLRRKKQIVVRAGKSYLAKAP